MKKMIGYVVAILVVGAMIVLMVKMNGSDGKAKESVDDEQNSSGTEKIGLEQGNTPPNFKLTTFDDEVIELSALKGKKVILNFWASWCGPCKAEMPHMQNYYENYAEEDNVEIVAVNMTTQERRGLTGIEEFIADYELTFPTPLDKEGDVIIDYGVVTIPTTYILGTNGRLEQKVVGPMDEKTIRKLVEHID